MSVETVTATVPLPVQTLPAWLTFLFAGACGLIMGNVFYAQPLISLISRDLGMSPETGGFIVTLTQLGFAAGMVLIVPLADLIENRRLIVSMIVVSVLALIGISLATQAETFLIAALFLGLTSASVQILVPFASHLCHESVRGRTVGNIMSGLMLGIMLSRPAASFLASVGSWKTVFVLSAIAMLVLAISLRFGLPVRKPTGKLSYTQLLRSMLVLARTTPVLQRRAIYHSFQFASFTLFWTVIPLVLTGPTFQLSQGGLALFALAGVAGVIAAPIAGRLADSGWSRVATGAGIIRGRRIPDHAYRCAWFATFIGPAGCCGHPHRFWNYHHPGNGAARNICAGSRSPWAPKRGLHDNLVHRRGHRLGGQCVGLFSRRLDWRCLLLHCCILRQRIKARWVVE
jgi:predicted MFS family arabinose efflux permease